MSRRDWLYGKKSEGGIRLSRLKTIGIVIVTILVLTFLIGEWTPENILWCHNPLSVPVLLKFARTKEVTIQPWAFVQLDLPRGTHSLEVFSTHGNQPLDSAMVVLPATRESIVIYSVQGAGTYVLGEMVEGGEAYQKTILMDQRILQPGPVGAPLLPGHSETANRPLWFEFAPAQRLVIAENAAEEGDWNGMLHHSQVAQKTFAPSTEDPFLSFSKGMEARALANLGRMEEALQAARSLSSATPVNTQGAILAQNLLLTYLSPHVVEKAYQEQFEKAPDGLNRILLGRVKSDRTEAERLLHEAATDPAWSHTAAEILLQRTLWEGDFAAAKELSSRLIAAGTDEEDDFLRTAYATCHLLSDTSPELVWRDIVKMLPRMDEPFSLVPWLVASAAQVGEVSTAMELLAQLDWGQAGGIPPGLPSMAYWKVQVLLQQKQETEARRLVEGIPRIENKWDILADLDSALAVLSPQKALKILETRLKENHPELEIYRLAGYHLAHECGLNEIGREILSPFSRKELGTPQRVIWEILEGDGWPPEKLPGFMVQHSPQETNDILFALALRAQLDGNSPAAVNFLERCVNFPPVPEFPSVLARREKAMLQ